MYTDYLYKEQPKRFNVFPGAEKYNKEKRQYKKKKKYKHPIIGPVAQILKDHLENKKIQKDFSSLDGSLGAIGNTCGKILKTAVIIKGLVTLAGIALLGALKYLNEKSKSFDEQYAPDGSFGYSGKSSGHISQKGLDFIINKEGGFHPNAYKVKGEKYYTIGYGEHGPHIHEGDVITEEEARKRLMKKINIAEKDVNKHVKVPISQNMFDALVSLSYNMAGGLSSATTLINKLNSGDYKGAAEAFKLYDKGKESGKVITYAGLTKRRAEESAIFASDITGDNKLKSEAQVVRGGGIIPNSSGKIHRYTNNTMIGNYKMNNTVAHGGQYYIDLSQRAEAYLRDVGGSGLVTSGAEGDTHAKGTGMTHEAGNKVDIVANLKTNEGWADTAIPFLKNKNTAFVVFEGFTRQAFLEIRDIIYSKIDSDLRKQCESKARQSGWGKLGGKYLDYDDSPKSMKNGRHLDIGILTNAYSANYQQEEAKNAKKLEEQRRKLEEEKKKEKEKTKQKEAEKQKQSKTPEVVSMTKTNNPKTSKNQNTGNLDTLSLENKKTLIAKKKGK